MVNLSERKATRWEMDCEKNTEGARGYQLDIANLCDGRSVRSKETENNGTLTARN